MNKEEFLVLSNGVRVVLTKASSHVSHIGLLINSGSRDDLQNSAGGMHLIEHLLFKGTKNRSYIQLMDYIESVGGDMNAYTSKEETCIYISIQNEFLDRAIDVLSDIFYNSQFNAVEFEKEKQVVIDEINSYLDSPSELIFDEFEEKFFEGHNLAGNILGTVDSVTCMTLDSLDTIYKSNYVSTKMIVSYVGSLNLDFVSKKIDLFFNRKENVSVECNERLSFVENNIFSLHKKRDTYQAHCMLGSLAPSMYSDLKTPMILLNNFLGGSSFNALLNLKLREERGLTYNIESNYTAYSDTGIFTVYFGTDIKKIKKCKEVIFSIFDDLVQNSISHIMLESYKKQLIGQVALSFDNFVSIMISNAKSYMCFDKVDTYDEIISKINAVTVSDIKNISTLVLDSSKISELIYS